MDILKAEIERKKKELEDRNLVSANKKYFKRSDLSKKEDEEYWSKSKRKRTDGLSHELVDAVSELGDNDDDVGGDDEENADLLLPRKEVIRKLRERKEPIRIFGEQDVDSFRRLKRLEIMKPEVYKGIKNDLKEAMDKVERAYMNEIGLGNRDAGGKEAITGDVQLQDPEVTWEVLQAQAEAIDQKSKKRNRNDEQQTCLKFFKLLLFVWGTKLNERSVTEKTSPKGRLASATHFQTVTFLKPLFRKLAAGLVAHDQADCLVEIVKHLVHKEYIKASEAYLEMAIGNAPWPIGATMVGIHARPGREKINQKFVAHVLNDETQRKYIQALKRLMIVQQKYFPVDPSHMVNYDPSSGAMTNYYQSVSI